MKKDFKKGDIVIAIGEQSDEIQAGKEYKVKKVDGVFVELYGCKYGYFKSCFKKKLKFPKVKELDTLSLINSRTDVNAEKIQEVIKAVNQLSEILEENLF